MCVSVLAEVARTQTRCAARAARARTLEKRVNGGVEREDFEVARANGPLNGSLQLAGAARETSRSRVQEFKL